MLSNNFYYIHDYSYESSYPCDDSCRDEGICRCYHIQDISFKRIDLKSLTKEFYDSYYDHKSVQFKRDTTLNSVLFGFDSDVFLYLVDRILRSNKVYNPEVWHIKWSRGYYGDEVDSVTIEPSVFDKINSDIMELDKLPDFESKVKFVLKLEYGYVLDSILSMQCKVIEVDKRFVIAGQEEYKKRINIDNEIHYSDENYDMIRAVCVQEGKFYRLIDGYHRFLSTKKRKIKIISFYKKD